MLSKDCTPRSRVVCSAAAVLDELDGEHEAYVVVLVCSAPPDGREHWSLRLLADRFVELEVVEQVSHEIVRQVLKKNELEDAGKGSTGVFRQKPQPSL